MEIEDEMGFNFVSDKLVFTGSHTATGGG